MSELPEDVGETVAPTTAEDVGTGMSPLARSHGSPRYWREEPLEVDAILDGSWGKWAIEVKTGRFEARELGPLLEFTRRHTEFRPLVLCDAEARATAERSGAQTLPWQEFLLGGPPGATTGKG